MAEKESQKSNVSRRAFLGGLLALGGLSLGAAKADSPVHAGHGVPAPDVSYKKAYPRQTCITPPGSQGHAHFHRFCTGCQLCVNACPNGVLTNAVSDGLALAAPVLSYEHGFCRPDCVRCSEVCPTGAIEPLTKARKTTVQIGRASVDYALCLAAKGEAHCGLCSRRCPAGAINMVESEATGHKAKVPAVNAEVCVGCGACEYFCPVRPQSAIHVEGIEVHRSI